MQNSKFSNETKILNYGLHRLIPIHQLVVTTLNCELNICSKCLVFFPTFLSLSKHLETCVCPFTKIYEEEDFKILKVKTLSTKQNISLISQAFIKTKTVYYEVFAYDFFVIFREEVLGYFSRHREGPCSLNCFLIFPCFQGQGWGTLLFDFSNIPSTNSTTNPEKYIVFDPKEPEKPYSKKAIICFRKYWKYKVMCGNTINEVSRRSNLTINNVIIGLEQQGFDLKEWVLRGEISIKKPRILKRRLFGFIPKPWCISFVRYSHGDKYLN